MKKIIAFLSFMTASGTAYALSVDTETPKTITADKIEYNVKTDTIKTSGNTEIVNKSGQRMTLTDSYLSKNGDNITGSDIKLWLGNHVYVESDDVVRDGIITTAYNAEFTACDGCDAYGNAWEISSRKIIHNMDDHMLQFFNPVFHAYEIPVFWLPYFEMPDPSVKYKTGFLMPDFSSTNNMGTQINIPLYINISDTHDLTFTTSVLTQENPLFQFEHRLNMEHSQYRTNAAFTHNKAGENRWYIFNNDLIELGEYARAQIYIARASDKTFLQKYGFYDNQPYLDSGASVELFGQSGYVVADAHIFQELRSSSRYYATPSGNILPNVRATYQTAPIYKETYLTFDADVLGISGDGTASQRLIGDARIVSPWTLWGGNRITASLSARYDVYNFHNTEMIDAAEFSGLKDRFLPSGYVEWGLPLFNPSTKWTQIIEPRARLTIMRETDENQFALNNDSAGTFLSDTTLFSDNRFSGLDLWENGTYADYGVRYAAFNKSGKMFEIFVGQTYDFSHNLTTDTNTGFHDGASDYVGRIEYDNVKWFDISSRFRLGRDDLSLQHIETSARVGTSKNYLNLRHLWSQKFIDTYRNNAAANDIHELSAGVGLQITERWAVRFNAVYNITDNRFQRHTGGIFYTHPCYYLSLQYRHDNAIKNDYVGTTTFQFKFGMSIDGQRY